MENNIIPPPLKSGEQNHDKPVSMAGVGTHEKALELVERFVPVGSRIADLAAGEGAFSVELKNLGYDVLAVDASDANWKANDIALRLCDFDKEFADRILVDDGGQGFDAVVAIEIVEHLENPFMFIRECAKMLKPGGVLFLTTPNVEAVFSRLLFLYTGRLNTFGMNETVRMAHLTPIFKWKLDMILDEAKFEIVEEHGVALVFSEGTNLKVRLTAAVSKLIAPLLKGDKGQEGRVIAARYRP